MVLAAVESISWKPEVERFPRDAKFLFVTSAIGKIRGLAESGLTSKFLAWSPNHPPDEPNHLTLDGLIREKAKKLVVESVTELRHVHGVPRDRLPLRYLVGDVHPSLGHPGSTGEEHLVKPKKNSEYEDLLRFIHGPWEKYKTNPVTVQLASAFAMVSKRGVPIGSNSTKKDSVFITYGRNPLVSLEDVMEYIDYLTLKRFPGYEIPRVATELEKVAGGIFHEYMYLYAREKGIEVHISSAMSCSLTENRSIYGIGAAGLTPAIIGWIDKQAQLKVR